MQTQELANSKNEKKELEGLRKALAVVVVIAFICICVGVGVLTGALLFVFEEPGEMHLFGIDFSESVRKVNYSFVWVLALVALVAAVVYGVKSARRDKRILEKSLYHQRELGP